MEPYDEYLKLQRSTTDAKHRRQWIDNTSIHWIAQRIKDRIPFPQSGICHGVRSGTEQLWFMEHLPGSRVIGTDVAHWSDNTPYQVMWDMHDMRPDWNEAFDFVYTNSWDHSYDLDKALNAWIRSLSVGGVLVLTHSSDHVHPSVTDPTGRTLSQLIESVNRVIRKVCPTEDWKLCIPPGAPDVVPPGFKASAPKRATHLFFTRSHPPAEHPCACGCNAPSA